VKLHAGSVPDGQHPWRCMFNTDAFYALRDQPVYHEVLRDQSGDVLGDLTYHASERVSGWSAPFGGPDWCREYWKPEQVHAAIDRILAVPLRVRMKPESFGECEALALQAMLQHGFSVEYVELNYAIRLPSVIDDYEATLSRQARAAIDRGEELDLQIVHAGESEYLWERGYEVLRANREAKGRALSLTLDYVRAIRDAFPGLVRMLLAYQNREMGPHVVAAALLYRVAAGRDVVQFWGDDPAAGLASSPMNLLVREVVQHAICSGAKVLDLGISTEGGVPNGGLCRFKRSVGAVAEPRYVLGR
jgi:hypothetical protein